MFLNFGIVIDAILMALGLLWCREMLGRWRKDLEDYRSAKEASTRQVVIILWVVTIVIILLMMNFFVGILKNLGVL